MSRNLTMLDAISRRASRLNLGGAALSSSVTESEVNAARNKNRKKDRKKCKKKEKRRCNNDAAACKATAPAACGGDALCIATASACCDTCSATEFFSCLLAASA